MPLSRMAAEEFARRLGVVATEKAREKNFAFFLGAGCSVTSGIRDAAGLVREDWLPKLKEMRNPSHKDLDEWAKEEFPGYDPNDAAAHYGPVMEALFPYDHDKQLEIERLCSGKSPAVGYFFMAELIAHANGCFSAVLTANFDDLLESAFYLSYGSRPLVISHESMAGYIRATRMRPLVVKLHGDYMLSPLNTAEETEALKEAIEGKVREFLNDRGLVFIGYGGRDKGILRMLERFPSSALHLGVYWASAQQPETPVRDWLEKRKATWVESGDFDELMMLLKMHCGTGDPDFRWFEKALRQREEKLASFSGRIGSMAADETPEAPALKKAAKRVEESLPGWWAVELAARRMVETDPNEAERIFEEGLKQFPDSANLINNYGLFLQHLRKDYGRAGEMYDRALESEPNNAVFLNNYAVLLKNVRKDDKAEEVFHRALEEDPMNANILGNYAGFLLSRGRTGEGLSLLEQALGLPDTRESSCVHWFYGFAHGPAEQGLDALSNIKRALSAGVRLSWWDASQNVERARQDGHPDADWLETLAQVINGKADISILDGWDRWREIQV